ncbi:helix-turn-helix transcriptional regulator [Leeuwenhoekiella marinoflava]|uniref:helix-turn-helix domain-containing protein n=1 Tax=Leeuwenhoekiella marinoflava TaxID=988 RepID=UPI003002D3DC
MAVVIENDMSKKTLGNQLKERRENLKITQSQVADLAGVSVNTLYKIERGQANPTLESLEKITDILGLELSLQLKKIEL